MDLDERLQERAAIRRAAKRAVRKAKQEQPDAKRSDDELRQRVRTLTRRYTREIDDD